MPVKLEPEFVTVYAGWNVWDVWQVNDLPFSILMVGVDRDRQLRIWVEDSVRLGAPGAVVADSIDLKGGQIQILNGPPTGLKTDQRKEQVPGPAMFVDGPATLRTVRFFNRGDAASLAWPHDSSYLLEKTYVPSETNPVTNSPPPKTIPQTVGGGVKEPVKDLLSELSPLAFIGGVIVVGLLIFKGELVNVARRVNKRRDSRSR